MAVVVPIDWSTVPIDQIITDDHCFVCDRPVVRTEPLVWWHGRGTTLVWHPSCAEMNGLALIQDAREAFLARGHGTYATRAARAAGSALRFREGVR